MTLIEPSGSILMVAAATAPSFCPARSRSALVFRVEM